MSRPSLSALLRARSLMNNPFVLPDMKRDAVTVVIEWNRHACHVRWCDAPATVVYYRRQKNAHGGESTFRYQRCELHPIERADYAFVYDENVAPRELVSGTPLTLYDAKSDG